MFLGEYKPEGGIIGSAANRAYTCSEAGLEKAMNEGIILEAMAVRCDEQMRLSVDLGGICGIIEHDEAVYTPDRDKARDIAVLTRVGKAVCFKVKRLAREDGKTVAYLSRRDAQLECTNEFLSRLVPGDIIDAKITHLESFGAFVDIGCGIISLLTIDCISVSRISHPRDRFKVGDRIRVVIRSIEPETGRIFVSRKELLGTWEENASLFKIGQTVAGIVRSIESYGIFVELTPNLAGLAECREDISVGQIAAVYIKNIIPEKMKLKLVLIDSYRGELEPKQYETSFDKGEKHIDSWIYSPNGSQRVIESIFRQESAETI